MLMKLTPGVRFDSGNFYLISITQLEKQKKEVGDYILNK